MPHDDGFFQEVDGRMVYVPPRQNVLYVFLFSALSPAQLLASVIRKQRCHVTGQLRRDREGGWHLVLVGPQDHLNEIEARVRKTMPLGQRGAQDAVH